MKSLNREVCEEIGFDIKYKIVNEVSVDLRTYKGEFKNIKISYLAKYISGKISLSEEHNQFKWTTFQSVKEMKNCKEWLYGVLNKAEKNVEYN